MKDPVFENIILATIKKAGFEGAQRFCFDQDASTRSYERLTKADGTTAILMKAPPGSEADGPCPPLASEKERLAQGWNATSRLAAGRVEGFVAVADFLQSLGYSAPRIFAADISAGVAVLEDLGDDLFAKILPDQADEAQLYAECGAFLADLHGASVPPILGDAAHPWPILTFDRLALSANANLFVDWVPVFLGQENKGNLAAGFAAVIDPLIEEVLAQKSAFVLRDVHAENLLWLPNRQGHARIGLLDFQDAVIGPRTWDISMLLHDARRDVSALAHRQTLIGYGAASGVSLHVLEKELAQTGAINILRIIGIFSRLVMRDGKQKYRGFMGRMVAHLRAVLAHEALGDLAAWIGENAPLDEIAAQGTKS